jgi:hypothetical protein
VTQSMDSTGSPRTGFSKKIRTLAIGALATAALSFPLMGAFTIVSHNFGRPPVVAPASHRLALNIVPNSLRLT